MMPSRRTLLPVLAACALSALALAAAGPCQAQGFPVKPLSLVVGFAPGGSADILARLMAQKLSQSLGQQVLVENKPGAGATIATAQVAAATADGHTLLFVTSGHAGAAELYPKLPYDPRKAFAPVALVGATPVVIVVPAASPFKSMADLIKAARQNPGKLNYAAGGGGATTTNLAAEFLKSEAKISMQAIPYKGSGPALTALLGGEIDFGFDIPSSALPLIKAGKLRALAVTSSHRSSVLPEVPTLSESALPNFDVVGWFGVLAPAATPSAVVTRLNQDINKALSLPEVREKLEGLAVDARAGTPAAFAGLIEADSKRYGEAIRRMGIKLD